MTIRLPSFLAVAAGSCALVIGCSGPDFGPEPDYASIDQRFSAPNGSLTEKNAASLFERYSSNAKSQGELDLSGASAMGGSSTAPRSAGLGPRSLQALGLGSEGASTSAGFRCDDIMSGDRTGSCDCPSGGSFDYDFDDLDELGSSGPVDIKLKTRFNACKLLGASVDGRQFVRLQTRRAIGDSGELGLSLLIVADFRIAQGGQTHAVDLVARLVENKLEMAINVDGGWVTVRATTSGDGSSGTYVVRDRDGAWTCEVANGKGTCTNDNGDTRTF